MPSLIIHLKDAIWFTPQGDVFVTKNALDLRPDELYELIKLAYFHVYDLDELMKDWTGKDPFEYGSHIQYEDYLQLVQKIRIDKATKTAKYRHTKIRRKEFNKQRSQIVLAMIEAGVPYKCGHPHCNATDNLTIDHIIPLSRGGHDDISNLQFLCNEHNGTKSDKLG